MTNSIGSSASSSMASKASSVLGNARQALKAMAEAATSPEGVAETRAAEAATKRGRLGTVLDCYA